MKSYLLLLLLASTSSFAHSEQLVAEQTIVSIETKEAPIPKDAAREMDRLVIGPGFGDILGYAKELVALGESVYTLVQKGRPVVNHRYAAINVLPRSKDGKGYVDPFDLEETSDAIKKKYVVSAKNKFRQEVIRFEYMVIFYVGKYEGKGKYIQNALIIPQYSKAMYGFDLNSQMKLFGIANKGTKAAPVASAVLNVSYEMGSLIKKIKANDTFTITGHGAIIKE